MVANVMILADRYAPENNQGGPETGPPWLKLGLGDAQKFLVHAAHAARAGSSGGGLLFVFLELGDERFGG